MILWKSVNQTDDEMTTRKTPEQQLAELETKQSQINARIQKKRAEVSKLKRKQDTRRKIIAGALALENMEQDGQFAEAMRGLLKTHITRPEDRKLFNL